MPYVGAVLMLGEWVDFHYEVNGKMYDFSIPGGGFVSLEHLVEVLGIKVSDTDDEAESVEKVQETSGKYDEAIKLNEVEVSEATRMFVADVASVEFSSPELVWIGKIDEATTVGGIKESRDLKVEYSTELTEEQIAEINAQTVEADDWTLISLRPFTTEETLTVTMKNGVVFTIRITDAYNNPVTLHFVDEGGNPITVDSFNGQSIPSGTSFTLTAV